MTDNDAKDRICPFAVNGDVRFHCLGSRCMMWNGTPDDGDCAIATAANPGPHRVVAKLPAVNEGARESATWPQP